MSGCVVSGAARAGRRRGLEDDSRRRQIGDKGRLRYARNGLRELRTRRGCLGDDQVTEGRRETVEHRQPVVFQLRGDDGRVRTAECEGGLVVGGGRR